MRGVRAKKMLSISNISRETQIGFLFGPLIVLPISFVHLIIGALINNSFNLSELLVVVLLYWGVGSFWAYVGTFAYGAPIYYLLFRLGMLNPFILSLVAAAPGICIYVFANTKSTAIFGFPIGLGIALYSSAVAFGILCIRNQMIIRSNKRMQSDAAKPRR